MYNKKICQKLRAQIDSSLFTDQENGIDAEVRLSFTRSIVLRLDIAMLMLKMILR